MDWPAVFVGLGVTAAGWLLYGIARWRIRRWMGGGECPLCGRRSPVRGGYPATPRARSPHDQRR